ncbi:MAG: hypothetical protein ACR2NN_28595 [Bryobacteraceae bacterium]
MRDPRIERLLGGYATNTLTEAERESLFEAALDDQELFNALQDEEALRDLLADADSRQAIARALQQPAVQRAKPWFAQGLVWGLAGTAAVACAVVLVVSLSRTQYSPPGNVAELKSLIPVTIPAAPAPTPATTPRPLKRRTVPQARNADQATNIQVAPAQAPAPRMARSTAFRASEGAVFQKAEGDAIPYSVWKRGADGEFAALMPGERLRRGDIVRLAVRPQISGSLTVASQISGELQSSLNVMAGQEYIVPDSPIQVTGERHLRLMLTTAVPPRTVVTNITLAPGKASDGR